MGGISHIIMRDVCRPDTGETNRLCELIPGWRIDSSAKSGHIYIHYHILRLIKKSSNIPTSSFCFVLALGFIPREFSPFVRLDIHDF